MRSPRKRNLWTSLLLLAAFAPGCSANDWFTRPSWAWFGEKEESPVATRADRIQDLRQLAKRLPGSDAAKREQVALELGKTIRDESDPLVRAQILRTIALCQTPVSDAVLRAGVQDSDARVRIAACDGLARRGGTEAVSVLGGVLTSDTNIDVRIAAARGLGELKDPGAVDALAIALDDTNPALQYRAVKSLEQSTGRNYGNDVEAWRQFAKGQTPQPRSPPLLARLRPF
jgi:HEAT repeat protein